MYALMYQKINPSRKKSLMTKHLNGHPNMETSYSTEGLSGSSGGGSPISSKTSSNASESPQEAAYKA